MFFITGTGQDQKILSFDQIMLCKCCGKFGHIQIIMTYSYFSFFFIPFNISDFKLLSNICVNSFNFS